MEQRSSATDAAVEDALTWHRMEESNYAAAMDALIKPSKEEYVGGTGQRSYYAAARVARILLGKEE
eukprot:scaffold6207_cov90-Skeletonema_marinoi.AAC.2